MYALERPRLFWRMCCVKIKYHMKPTKNIIRKRRRMRGTHGKWKVNHFQRIRVTSQVLAFSVMNCWQKHMVRMLKF